jgi:glycosyltransferase involved in cell wall biosynthesis
VSGRSFLDFLRCHEAPKIYLVGDVVDFWRIRRGIYWPQSHNDVLQKLLRKVRKGSELIFIPGNHDEAMREYCGSNFGGIAIERMMRWSRGVDVELFKLRDVRLFGEEKVFLYVGRIAVEKNIKAFLDFDLPGRKVLVGSGPQAAEFERLYPDALFAGPKQGEDLAKAYASADVFVFPSLTDTFGLVLLEALASGVPVAAYRVSGPKDVLTDPACGALGSDLQAMAIAIAGRNRRGSSLGMCSKPII